MTVHKASRPALPLSARYLPALAVVLALALVPTVVHSYRGFEVKAEPVTSDMLPRSVGGAFGVDTGRSDAWVRSTYAADSWAERAYDVPGQGRITAFAVRSFDMKKLYHHPELGVLRGRDFERARVVALGGDASRPVHVLRNATGGESAVYALEFGGQWVANPYWLQTTSAVSSLWTGRQPIMLVMVYGSAVLTGDDVPTEPARAILAQALGAAPTGGVLP